VPGCHIRTPFSLNCISPDFFCFPHSHRLPLLLFLLLRGAASLSPPLFFFFRFADDLLRTLRVETTLHYLLYLLHPLHTSLPPPHMHAGRGPIRGHVSAHYIIYIYIYILKTSLYSSLLP
jgi:hypothetical protein